MDNNPSQHLPHFAAGVSLTQAAPVHRKLSPRLQSAKKKKENFGCALSEASPRILVPPPLPLIMQTSPLDTGEAEGGPRA